MAFECRWRCPMRESTRARRNKSDVGAAGSCGADSPRGARVRPQARTHDAGADAFGAPPRGWAGPGYFGPLQQPLPMSYSAADRWGRFYANERLAPMTERAAGQLDAPTRSDIDAVMARCDDGEFDDD